MGFFERLGHFKNPAMRVYVIHGESSISDEFAGLVRSRFGFEVHVPAIGDRITDYAAIEPGQKPVEVETRAPVLSDYLAELAQKADALRSLLAAGSAELPDHVLRRIEDEMLSARTHLDEALQCARDKR